MQEKRLDQYTKKEKTSEATKGIKSASKNTFPVSFIV